MTPPITEPDLINVRDAARITGLAVSTIYKLARQGRLRSFKVLRALRFDRWDVVRLIVERTEAENERRR